MPAPHRGGLIPSGSHPDPNRGTLTPGGAGAACNCSCPSRGVGGWCFTITLHLTNCFGVSLSLLFRTREVSMWQKFLLEIRRALCTITFQAIFIILVLKTAQLLLHDIPVLPCIDNASLPFLISRFH